MKKLVYFSLGIFLSLFLLLSAIEFVSFNTNHYLQQYEKNNISARVKIDESNLKYVTDSIVLYLRDDLESLNIEALWDNEKRAVFSEREIEHMKDVKNLFVLGRRVRRISLLAILCIVIGIVKLDKDWRKNLSKVLVYAGVSNYALLLGLYICMRYDFSKYFDYFHLLFFSNDLWILDPSKEILVQILPETFFYSTAVKIALTFFIPLTILGLSSSYYLFFRKGFE